MEKIEQAVQEIANNRSELLALLKTLVAFPTVSPPARNAAVAQAWLADQLSQLGFSIDRWDVFPSDPNVVGVLRGTAPETHNSLIINGHVDVAEVGDGHGWLSSPFEWSKRTGVYTDAVLPI